MSTFDSLITQYERKVALLKEIRALIESDPALAAEITAALTPEVGVLFRSAPPSERPTQLKRLMELLADGQWRTLEDIANTLGAPKGSIAPLFYKNKTRASFESRRVPGKARTLEWHLKETNQEAEDEKV